jgi:hypothetical protein
MDNRISIAGQAWMSQDTELSDAAAPVPGFSRVDISLQCVINLRPMVLTLQSFSLGSRVGLSGAMGIVGVT